MRHSASPIPPVRRAMEPYNGHLYPDPNQNHIGKSPGANPLDHATHSSSMSSIFILGRLSGFVVTESMRHITLCWSRVAAKKRFGGSMVL